MKPGEDHRNAYNELNKLKRHILREAGNSTPNEEEIFEATERLIGRANYK